MQYHSFGADAGKSTGRPCCHDSVLSSIICCTSNPAAAVVSGALFPSIQSRNIVCCARNISSRSYATSIISSAMSSSVPEPPTGNKLVRKQVIGITHDDGTQSQR